MARKSTLIIVRKYADSNDIEAEKKVIEGLTAIVKRKIEKILPK